MTIEDLYPAPGVVKRDGTALGAKLSVTTVGIREEYEFLTRQPYSRMWTDARWMGSNAVLNFNIAEATQAVAAALYGDRYAGGVAKSVNSRKFGHRLSGNSWTIVPDVDGHPPFELKDGILLEIAPLVWDKQQAHLQSTQVTVAGLLDWSATGEAWEYTAGTSPATTDYKTVGTFLAAIGTVLEGITVDGDSLHVHCPVPRIDIDAFLRIPGFPAALVADLGGEYSPYDADLREGQIEVVLVDFVPRDHLGIEAAKRVEAMGDDLVDALAYSQDYSMYLAADDDLGSVTGGPGTLKTVVFKGFRFRYRLRRRAT